VWVPHPEKGYVVGTVASQQEKGFLVKTDEGEVIVIIKYSKLQRFRNPIYFLGKRKKKALILQILTKSMNQRFYRN
jgi:hypothetical protein